MSAADHLEVSRQHGLFNHHGIDLGDGTIAHFLEGREIIRSSIEEFAKGSQFIVVSHKNSSSKRITLTRAMSRIGEKNYNLLFNNCEHFANWCKTGYHKSPQIDMFFKESLKASDFISNLSPKSLYSGLNLIFRKIIKDKDKILEELEKISKLKIKLEKNLYSILKQAKAANYKNNSNSKIKYIMVAGQTISDQLNLLNNIEHEISQLLKGNKDNEISKSIGYYQEDK